MSGVRVENLSDSGHIKIFKIELLKCSREWGMKDTFTKVGFIVVIILLVVTVVGLSDYVIKIEPKTTTTTIVTMPTTTSVSPTTTGVMTTTTSVTTTPTTTTTFDCSKAGFKLITGSYVKYNAQLTLTLENTKSVNLTMKYIFFVYPNDVVIRKPIRGVLEGLVLEGYNTRSFLISQIEDGFISGKVTTNCPDVTVDFTYSDVT